MHCRIPVAWNARQAARARAFPSHRKDRRHRPQARHRSRTGDGLRRKGEAPDVVHLHRHAVRLRDVPVGEKFFFFVRDPVSRFVSGFHSR